MRFWLLFLLILGALGCNKPNPNPELVDEIYLDLNNQAQAAARELEVAKKTFEGHKKDLAAVVPQTGEIKYAQKRYFESEVQIQRIEQKKKYLELKASSRKAYAKKEYTKAFKEGKPWPSPEEIEAYRTYKSVADTPKAWDTKKRVDLYEVDQEKRSFSSESPEKTP